MRALTVADIICQENLAMHHISQGIYIRVWSVALELILRRWSDCQSSKQDLWNTAFEAALRDLCICSSVVLEIWYKMQAELWFASSGFSWIRSILAFTLFHNIYVESSPRVFLIPLKMSSNLLDEAVLDGHSRENLHSTNVSLRGSPGQGYYLEMAVGTPPQMVRFSLLGLLVERSLCLNIKN